MIRTQGPIRYVAEANGYVNFYEESAHRRYLFTACAERIEETTGVKITRDTGRVQFSGKAWDKVKPKRALSKSKK